MMDLGTHPAMEEDRQWRSRTKMVVILDKGLPCSRQTGAGSLWLGAEMDDD